MTPWDWLWAWTGDDAAWDWFRTVLAALFGALVGGLFTLLGQRGQSEAQRQLQQKQFAADAAANQERWDHERKVEARTASLADARVLFEEFTALHRACQSAKPSLSESLRNASWEPKWKLIWTENQSLDMDVRARLITDPVIRSAVSELVRYMDSIPNLTKDGSPYPRRLGVGLREAALQLTAEGIEIVGAYIRNEPHVSERGILFDALRKTQAGYAEWEEFEEERAMANAEAMAEFAYDDAVAGEAARSADESESPAADASAAPPANDLSERP